MEKPLFRLREKIGAEPCLRGLLSVLLVLLAILFVAVVFDGCPRWIERYLGVPGK